MPAPHKIKPSPMAGAFAFLDKRFDMPDIETGAARARKLPRIACLIGGVVDGIMLIPMLSPRVGGAMFGIEGFAPGPEYRYAMGVAASLMLGWTLLLLWSAGQPPRQQAGVLLLTAIVVLALMLAGGYAVQSGMVRLGRMVPTWLMQGSLEIVFLAAFLQSRPAR
jgi:hypothetical protein